MCSNTPSDRERIEAKEWVAQDEHIELDSEETLLGDKLYQWWTESYIPGVSVEEALDDNDVIVGDIDLHDYHGFVIYLYSDFDDDTGGSTVETEQCVYDKPWQGQCPHDAIPGGDPPVCHEHEGKTCHCGTQATRGCSATMGLVCGRPLCDDCDCNMDHTAFGGI